MNAVQEDKSLEPPRSGELKNAELVSRFLAATPPYLYGAMPLQPHAFFFSEMLRSFVQARHAARTAPQFRRAKKRPFKYFAGDEPVKTDWHHHQPWLDRPKPTENKERAEKEKPEVPLELTVDKSRPPSAESPNIEVDEKQKTPFIDVDSDGNQSNLILPPPPPMWYPPIYNPQYGVDPLNFFIDLRVSGQLYDRKRTEFPTQRHTSAFSVPQKSGTTEVSQLKRGYMGTPYVMKNLKKIYMDLKPVKDETASD